MEGTENRFRSLGQVGTGTASSANSLSKTQIQRRYTSPNEELIRTALPRQSRTFRIRTRQKKTNRSRKRTGSSRKIS